MTCKHGEISFVCGSCDNELVSAEEEKRKLRLKQLDREIDEGNFYDDPQS